MLYPDAKTLVNLRASLGPDARSQNFQDVFVLCVLEQLRGGYFVEVGAANGVEFSNTHLLEKRFGWTGILVEPSVNWHPHLRARRSAKLDTRCAWSRSGLKIPFCQFPDANLSTVALHADSQGRDWHTSPCERYEVETASLADILQDAPPVVDYLSVDVEGSEAEILGAYDFSRRFKVITCEHNFKTKQREQVHRILSSHGYLRVCEHLSNYDDWYVVKT
jgi:FkbM family methyltransferase